MTGSLHIGHALNNTIQDILVRFNRMRGKDVLWQPGTDHAGIATQMIVERQLMERQEPGRREMGREKFLERVWAWKAESGGTIINQLKRLGASADWSRERFTMDEGLSAAVRKVFIELYEKGLIYRAKRLVNWHPGLETAISDLEVENIETDGKMWHLSYPIENSHGDDRRRHHAARDDARRRRRRRASRRSALQAADRQVRHPAARRPPHPDHRRRVRRSGAGLGRGEDHAGARLQRFRGRPAARPQADQHLHARRADQRQCAARNIAGSTASRRARRCSRTSRRSARSSGSKTRRSWCRYDEKTKQVVIEPYLTDQWFVNAEVLAKPALASVQRGPHQVRAAELARTPISPGWRTSSPGAFRASSGGAIRSRPGTARA